MCAQHNGLTHDASKAMSRSMKRSRRSTGSCKMALGLMQSCPNPALLLYVLHTASTSSSVGRGNGSPQSSWSPSCLALARRSSNQSGNHVPFD